jgi:hypothetical protein
MHRAIHGIARPQRSTRAFGLKKLLQCVVQAKDSAKSVAICAVRRTRFVSPRWIAEKKMVFVLKKGQFLW